MQAAFRMPTASALVARLAPTELSRTQVMRAPPRQSHRMDTPPIFPASWVCIRWDRARRGAHHLRLMTVAVGASRATKRRRRAERKGRAHPQATASIEEMRHEAAGVLGDRRRILADADARGFRGDHPA